MHFRFPLISIVWVKNSRWLSFDYAQEPRETISQWVKNSRWLSFDYAQEPRETISQWVKNSRWLSGVETL
ncbi:MAG TPA: hypothetical protein DCS91_02235 [Microcoleaceae bacterium UBA11344]|nr:hypothetical protein [Microcoleaceae cyanobacterium UBA11344]